MRTQTDVSNSLFALLPSLSHMFHYSILTKLRALGFVDRDLKVDKTLFHNNAWEALMSQPQEVTAERKCCDRSESHWHSHSHSSLV